MSRGHESPPEPASGAPARARSSRVRLMVIVVIVAIVVPSGVVALSMVNTDDADSGLRIEVKPDDSGVFADVVLYVEPEANRSETSGGRNIVELQCLDRSDRILVSSFHFWPLIRVPGEVGDPQIHKNLRQSVVRRLKRCRLKGTRGPLAGPVRPVL